MILLFNVKITSQGLSYYHRSEWLPKYDRLAIFKYCLASYASMTPLLSRCLFYIQLEPEFESRRAELEAWIRDLFPADKLELNWHRINYTREWRELTDQYFTDPEQLIWFAGNDDHIFIDYNLDMVRSAIDTLTADPDPLSVVYYSHWPEQMRLSVHHNGQLTDDGNFIKFTWRTFDAIRILKAYRFQRYWYDNDFGDSMVYRTDHLWHAGYELTGPVYAPTREMVRHYDGYSHVGDLINITPPLVIPEGFFNNNIKIRIGNVPRSEGYVNFNPMSPWLYAADPSGTDYRWIMSDIPLFWQSHIGSIEIANDYNQQTMEHARDMAYLASTRIPMTCYSTTFTDAGAAPATWFSNHFKYGKN